MADDKQPPQQTGVTVPDWRRSPFHRNISSNILRYRCGAGEVACTFATIIDGYTPSNVPNTIEDQIGITMSWTHLKSVSSIFNMMVSAIEEITGEIRLPMASQDKVTQERDRANFIQQVKNIYLQVPADGSAKPG
jgi:hypothetical protein